MISWIMIDHVCSSFTISSAYCRQDPVENNLPPFRCWNGWQRSFSQQAQAAQAVALKKCKADEATKIQDLGMQSTIVWVYPLVN